MIALVLQFYQGDKPQAMRLARMIADIEELPRDDVTFIFMARFDTEHDEETVSYVRTKFPHTETHQSTTRFDGWPGGPNGIARDVLLMLEQRGEFNAALLIEPDCVPLNRHWLNILASEWHDARSNNKVMMGAWRNSGPPGGHVNGNSVIIPALATWLRKRGLEVAQFNPGLAWDCLIAPFVREHWWVTGRIANRFQSRNATEDDLLTPELGDEPPCLVHGFKDSSAYDWAMKKLRLVT